MARPLIAVSTAIEELPTAFGATDCTKLTTAYTDALYAVGGQPVILPVIETPPTDLLAHMDGLVLTGGGDIDPTMYGEPPDPTVYGIRPDRDTFEVALYAEALERRIPILAICRGMQLINILRGGSLLQDIGSDHWQSTPSADVSHSVSIDEGSAVAVAVGTCETGVNSYHHQAVGRLGAGLRVTARCGDIVEAFEADDMDLLAIQWHPEQMAASVPTQRALFDSFVQRAAARSRIQEETPCPTT